MSDETARRDERGVRKQTYKRFKPGEDYTPIKAGESRAMLEIMKKPFLEKVSLGQKKYEDIQKFKEVIISYFDYISAKNDAGAQLIPDIEGFCAFAGICRDTLNDWERTRPGEFSDTIKIFKNMVASFKKQMALKGRIPPIVFATDFNNNHGYTQKQEVTLGISSNPLGQLQTPEEILKQIPDIPVDVEWKDYE